MEIRRIFAWEYPHGKNAKGKFGMVFAGFGMIHGHIPPTSTASYTLQSQERPGW